MPRSARAGAIRRAFGLRAQALAEARRIGIGAVGPVAVAGTQFLASMLVWAQDSAAAFGLFSFGLVLIQLSFGVSNALVGTPLAVADHPDRAAHRHACLSAHGAFVVLAAGAVAVGLGLAGGGMLAAGCALWTVVANLRWAARADSIADGRIGEAARSDTAYVAVALPLLLLALASGHSNLASAIGVLIVANAAALGWRSRAFLRRQLAAVRQPCFRWYREHVWRRQSGWSLAGVVSTEASSNAHAYVVTWQLGAAAYAPLALGSLFCRPVTIFLTALTQIDRPVFVRHVRAGALNRVRRLLATSGCAAALVLTGNILAAVAVLALFAPAIAARGYDPVALRTIVALWLAIMALRSARAPLSTLLQATGRFRPLALCSMASALLSVAGVLVAVGQGPVWTLAGILAGEMLLLAAVALLARKQLA